MIFRNAARVPASGRHYRSGGDHRLAYTSGGGYFAACKRRGSAMFRWVESLIPVFPPVGGRMPPRKVLPFYLHYLRPVWPVLLATLIAGLLLALVEVAMFDYLGRIVDMVAEQPGADFFKRHANELGWMLFITVIARPILVGLHNLLVNQAIVPGL